MSGVETRSQTRKPSNLETSTIDNTSIQYLSKEEASILIETAVAKAVAEATAHLFHDLYRLKVEVLELKTENQFLKKKNNQLEQYSRRSNIRIRGLEVPEGESSKRVVAAFINDHLKGRDGKPVEVTENDFDAAHPLPPLKLKAKPNQEKSINSQLEKKIPVLIVKFHDRDTRDAVIKCRRSLKGTNFTIQEDLTRANADLLNRLSNAPGMKNAWSWGGKIFAIASGERKPQRYDIDANP